MSVSEIDALVRRAALGLGLPYGLAEEAGQAAAWLAAAGLDDGAALADAAAGVLPGCRGRGETCLCWRDGEAGRGAVLCTGPAILDRLALHEEAVQRVRLDVPLVLIGMLGVRQDQVAGQRPVRLEIAGEPTCRVSFASGTMTVEPSDVAALAAVRDAIVLVAPAGAMSVEPEAAPFPLERNRRRALGEGAELAPEAAERLGRWARLSLVPSSAQSRERGAGAGLIERD